MKNGNIPFNKGKKGYMSAEQYEKCKQTMFKKGNIPANHRPIGSERVGKDGYILIKIQDKNLQKNWMPKHRYLYEQKYGKIPEGYKLIFADGNKLNFDLDNLVLVSYSEELIMNRRGLISDNADITKTGVIADNELSNLEILTRTEAGRRTGWQSRRKGIVMLNDEGIISRIFKGTRDAADKLFISRQTVSDYCNKKVINPMYKLYWADELIEEEEK